MMREISDAIQTNKIIKVEYPDSRFPIPDSRVSYTNRKDKMNEPKNVSKYNTIQIHFNPFNFHPVFAIFICLFRN